MEITKNGRLVIEDSVNITQNVLISSNAKITIGKSSLIGENVSLRDSDHGTLRNEKIQKQNIVSEKIEIKNDVWIGANSIILKGSVLQEGAIIGANSLVLKKSVIDPYTIYAGSPVRKIKERD